MVMGPYLCGVPSNACTISRNVSLAKSKEAPGVSRFSVPGLRDKNKKIAEKVVSRGFYETAEFCCQVGKHRSTDLSVTSEVLTSSGEGATHKKQHLPVHHSSSKSFSCSDSNQLYPSLNFYSSTRQHDSSIRSSIFHHSRYHMESNCRSHVHTGHPRRRFFFQQMIRNFFLFIVLLTLFSEGQAAPKPSSFHHHERGGMGMGSVENGNMQVGEGRTSERRRDGRIGDHHLFTVDNRHKALGYLKKYGYLNCTDPAYVRPRLDASHSSRSDSTNTHNLNILVQEGAASYRRGSTGHLGTGIGRGIGTQVQEVCTNQTVQAAIRLLQERFHLEPTGRFDSATRQTMSKGRCGNTDKETKLITTTKTRRTPGNYNPMEKSTVNSKYNRHRNHRARPYQHFKPIIDAMAAKNTWETLYDLSDGGRWYSKTGREQWLRKKVSQNDEMLSISSNLVIPPPVLSSYNHLVIDPYLESKRQRITAKRRLNTYSAGLATAQRRTRKKRNPGRNFPPQKGSDTSVRVGLKHGAKSSSASNFISPVEAIVDIAPDNPAVKPEVDRRRKMLEELTMRKWREEARKERKRRNRLSRHHRRVRRRILAGGGGRGFVEGLERRLTRWGGLGFTEGLDRNQSKAARERIQRGRRKRSIVFHGNIEELPVETPGMRFSRDEVRWRLLAEGYSHRIPVAEQKAALELSFRMWSEVIPLKFAEDYTSDIKEVDILIAFAKNVHLGCDKTFDGHGGELAHSWAKGDIHFDDDENYKNFDDGDGDNINLLKVAVHEVGHVLGLLHTNLEPSIMYPIYVTQLPREELELLRLDRDAAQKLYGVCKGTFNAVFDMVRRIRVPGIPEDLDSTGSDGTHNHSNEPAGTWRYIYNTFFFRKNRFWKYENSANRTRYGDPSILSRAWTGVPDEFNAVTQVLTQDQHSPTDYVIDTYFFKGDQYYKYLENEVMEGYPRQISSDFVASQGCNETLPTTSDLYTVYFNHSDDHIYFYDREWVWLVNVAEIGGVNMAARSCPIKRHFSDLYDVIEGPVITGDVTAVFHSYNYRTTFVLKNEDVYEVITPGQQTTDGEGAPSTDRTKLIYISPWYNVWHDICDVD